MSRTQDEEFNLCQNNLLKLEETLISIQSNLTTSLSSWKTTFRSTLELSSSLRSFFERNESPLTIPALRFEAVHESMHSNKLAMLEKLIADHISAPISSYLALVAATKARIKERDTARQSFDHYHAKILKLRAEKDVLTSKNKFGLKDHEKLQRNETKYKEAAIAYRAVNRAVATEMWDVWRKRWDVMEDVMQETVKNEVLFVRALANQLDPMLAEVKKVKGEAKEGKGRMREGKEAPFFTAKPPVGLEELEDEDKKRERMRKARRAGAGDEEAAEVGEEEEDEDALFEDPDEMERKARPKRREEVKAAPVVRRKPALALAPRGVYAEDGEEEAEYDEELPPEEDEEVISSQDFFAAAAAPQPAVRKPAQKASPPHPTTLPKKIPAKRAPAAPTPGDPFAALSTGGGGAAIDPFFVAAGGSILASTPAAAPSPVAAAPKKKVGVTVDASAVDFFSNAMSVSSSSPVHSAFAPPAAVPFTEPVKPKVKKQPSTTSFAGGLPPLPSPTASPDDPFAGLPLAPSPVPSTVGAAGDKPVVEDFFASPAPATGSPSAPPSTSQVVSRRPSLPTSTPPAPSSRSNSLTSESPPHAQPPPPPPPAAVKAKKKPQPAPASAAALPDEEDRQPPAPAPAPPAAHPAPPPPMPRQPSMRAAAAPPPPASFAPPPPPPAGAAKAPPPRSAAPPPPPSSAAAPPPPLPAPVARAGPALPPPPPASRGSVSAVVAPPSSAGFQPPPPPPAAVRKAPSRRRVVEEEDNGPAFEVPEADAAGNDPFAAFN